MSNEETNKLIDTEHNLFVGAKIAVVLPHQGYIKRNCV